MKTKSIIALLVCIAAAVFMTLILKHDQQLWMQIINGLLYLMVLYMVVFLVVAVKEKNKQIRTWKANEDAEKSTAFTVEGKAREDVKVISEITKWNSRYAILENGKGERGIFIRSLSNFHLTAAWIGMEKDFGL